MDVYNEQKNSEVLKQFKKEEFFGLRDFYRYEHVEYTVYKILSKLSTKMLNIFFIFFSLVKMIFCYTRRFEGVPPVNIIEDAIKRNFSGLDEIDAWSKFKTKIIPILEVRLYSNGSSS